jgi:glycosyltransferase involved in cell wall biosynthesis
MATLNQAQYLTQALTSLQTQTLARDRYEVVVIDDGSNDETPRLLLEWNPLIRLVSRDKRGLVGSCNEGLGLARGRYFARVDSDDVVAPNWLASMVAALDETPDACLAYPDRIEVDVQSTRRINCDAADIYSLQACGTVFRTDILRRIGGFRPFYWEEYDLYFRLRGVGEWVHVSLPLYVYRKHDASMTARASDRINGWMQLAMEWGADTLRSSGAELEMEQALALLEGSQSR